MLVSGLVILFRLILASAMGVSRAIVSFRGWLVVLVM
jgi:hypothetical protein